MTRRVTVTVINVHTERCAVLGCDCTQETNRHWVHRNDGRTICHGCAAIEDAHAYRQRGEHDLARYIASLPIDCAC